MALKASFGFGENVCWTEIGRALREASVRSAEEQHLTMSSRWVTRINIKVDRVACPWLIRRFIDPRAEFIFVPENELLQAARAMNATPFDAPKISEIKLNHRGERCTFEAILEDFHLGDAALQRLGLIVRAADVKGRDDDAPEGIGLRAVANGFAAMGLSDEERLARQFPVYDALYRYVQSLS